MVENQLGPRRGCVALLAGLRFTVALKLSSVAVVMAPFASRFDRLEQGPRHLGACVDGFVTLLARHGDMLASQRKTGFVMIEKCLSPASGLVAGLTTLRLDSFDKLAFVDIRVTAFTCYIREIKASSLPHLTLIDDAVACQAGYRKMCAGQGVVGLVVLRDIKCCGNKAGNGMTALTAAAVTAVGKLALVNILVAITTVGKWYPGFLLAAAVTLGAGHALMHAKQRKAS